MPFPTVEAVTGGNNTTASTSHVVNLPTGIAAGNLLLVFFGCYTTASTTISFPSGWTLVFDEIYTGYVRLVCYSRIASGSEGSTITVTTSTAVATAHTSYRIIGHDPNGWIWASVPATGNTNSPNPLSLTPSWGPRDTLFFAAVCVRGTATINAYPANYTGGRYDHANISTGCGVGTARRALNAATEDPGAFTLSANARCIAITISVPGTVISREDASRFFVMF